MTPGLKKYLPHLAAIVIFAVVTLIYFRPLLSGKELRQGDITRHKSMSKEIVDYREKYNAEPLWTNSMFGGMPAYQISTLYPGNWLNHLDAAFKLYLPHPGGYLFLYCLGFFVLLLCLEVNPWLATLGGLAYGLSSYFLIVIEAGHNSKANALGYLPMVLGGVVLLFRQRYWAGLALTALATGMELNANHVQISYYGYILIGFVILGYFVAAVKSGSLLHFGKALGLFVAATLIGLLPNAGNLTLTNEYGKYSTRGKSELTIKANLKKNQTLDEARSGNDAVSAAEPIKEQYERNTTSGLDQDYATQWSYGVGETFSFLIPDFKGGASNPIRSAYPEALKKVNPDFREQVASSNAYFGDQPFTSGPVYIGAIVMFLALLGMFTIKNPLKWPLFFATVLTVALGWGSNFMPLTDFFMHYVPGYNKFRAVSMTLVIAELTLPLMAILAIHEALAVKNWETKLKLSLLKREVSLKKLVLITAGVVGGFCLLGYLAPDMVNSFRAGSEEAIMINEAVRSGASRAEVEPYVAELMPQIEIARKAIFKADAMRSFIFIALAFVLLYLYFTNKIKRELFLGTLGLFIVIDLWTVDTRYLNNDSFVTKEQNRQMLVEKTAADEEILRDTDPNYRVLNLTTGPWQDATTSYYHKSVGGYHGAKLKKYQELIDFVLDKEINYLFKNGNQLFGSDSVRQALLGSLGALNMLNTRYIILPGGGQDRQALVMKNSQANGNAWFVKNVIPMVDADEELLALRKLDSKTTAITRQTNAQLAPFKNQYAGDGQIKLVSYKPNELVYESQAPSDGFAVFSEIYYPEGWNAYLDGKPTPHIATNYVLRGMPVPAGNHKIEFRFEPASYANSNKLAMAGSLLLVLTVAAGLYFNRKKNVIVS